MVAGDEVAQILDVPSVYLPFDNQLDDLLILQSLLEPACCREFYSLLAAKRLADFVQRSVGIERIDGKVATYALGDADVLGIGSVLDVTLAVEH